MGNIRFRGFFRHTLDDRKRLQIPSQFRTIIISASDGKVVMTPGYDGEISIYALRTWEAIESKELISLSMDKAQARRYRRHFTFGIKEDHLDGQGRILLPDFLLEHAGLSREAVIVGEIDYFTVWSPSAYENYRKLVTENYLKDAETIEDLRRHDEGSNH